jgi:predicted metal-dependent phosphoesterase TrpH
MNGQFDLHSHSAYSDGTLTPTELVTRAAAAGVGALALTDHDVTAGLDEAQIAADQVGLILIPGVEISVSWYGRTIHVVGLNVDRTNATLQTGLARLRQRRDERGREIGRRLAARGLDGAHEGASALSRGPIISRTHFARHLVETGHARDMGQAFRRYLSKGRPGYVSVQWATLGEAVDWIRDAGGQAVIAHPARYKLGSKRMQSLLEEFRDCGGIGVEVVCGSHSEDDSLRFARLAGRLGLRASTGSDYHGPEQTWIALGKLPPLPAGCVPIWQDW